DQLLEASKKLVIAVHHFLGAYCGSVRCGFDVLPLKSFESGERQQVEVITVDEKLSVFIDSVQNIPAEWMEQFHSFYVGVHVLHGTIELCRGIREPTCPLIHDNVFSYCRMDTWSVDGPEHPDVPVHQRSVLDVSQMPWLGAPVALRSAYRWFQILPVLGIATQASFDLQICVLPRETRILVMFYGIGQSTSVEQSHSPNTVVEPPRPFEQQLGFTSFPVFNHEGSAAGF
ncbi:unnamed protein product, partial [Gongylonema pulchrum]|uniref:C2 PI3K-type domain-containing protein n=1 Tax=Gongylonema pulchrum TaxID=637853 RepID=A0A183D2W6_9BILA